MVFLISHEVLPLNSFPLTRHDYIPTSYTTTHCFSKVKNFLSCDIEIDSFVHLKMRSILEIDKLG